MRKQFIFSLCNTVLWDTSFSNFSNLVTDFESNFCQNIRAKKKLVKKNLGKKKFWSKKKNLGFFWFFWGVIPTWPLSIVRKKHFVILGLFLCFLGGPENCDGGVVVGAVGAVGAVGIHF